MKLDRIIAVRNRKIVYWDGDLCVKVFDGSYSKADVLCEAQNQARAEEMGLPVPRVQGVTVLEGRWAIVSEHIRGKTLAQQMQEAPGQREEHLRLLCQVQSAVLSHTCPYLPLLHDTLHRKIAQAGLDSATRKDLLARLGAMPHHAQLCHGDMTPENIQIAEDGTPYILDWPHAAQGDGAADAAQTYLSFCLAGEGELAEQYLALFCAGGGAPRTAVAQWLPFVAAARRTAVQRQQLPCIDRFLSPLFQL